MHRLLAFYDDDNIGPDTCVVFTLEQAVRFHPYLIARRATAEDLRQEIEFENLFGTCMGHDHYVSLVDLEAFVAGGFFRAYSVDRFEFRCSWKLFDALDLSQIGCVRAD